jgi:ABC-type sulfate/molybdate transport systems ATPase subunit
MAGKIAHFPFLRALEDFDLAARPALDPGQVRELATARWVANGDCVLLLGPPSRRHDAHLSTSLKLQTRLARIAR